MNNDIITVENQEFEIIKEFDCVHSFTKNIYVRSGTMKKGMMVVGHIHKEPHLNILSVGSMELWIDGVITTVVAPAIFEAPANSRKILYTLEDCVFSNIHNSDKVDLQELEDELIDKKPIDVDLTKLAQTLIKRGNQICG